MHACIHTCITNITNIHNKTLHNIILHSIHTYIHTYIHTHTYKHIHTNTYIQTHTYKHIHTNTYIQTHTYKHIHTNTYIQTHTYKHIHTNTYIHTYIHAYIHTYMHTYIHTSRQAGRQAGRQADRQTDRHTHTHIYIYILKKYFFSVKSRAQSMGSLTKPAGVFPIHGRNTIIQLKTKSAEGYLGLAVYLMAKKNQNLLLGFPFIIGTPCSGVPIRETLFFGVGPSLWWLQKGTPLTWLMPISWKSMGHHGDSNKHGLGDGWYENSLSACISGCWCLISLKVSATMFSSTSNFTSHQLKFPGATTELVQVKHESWAFRFPIAIGLQCVLGPLSISENGLTWLQCDNVFLQLRDHLLRDGACPCRAGWL